MLIHSCFSIFSKHYVLEVSNIPLWNLVFSDLKAPSTEIQKKTILPNSYKLSFKLRYVFNNDESDNTGWYTNLKLKPVLRFSFTNSDYSNHGRYFDSVWKGQRGADIQVREARRPPNYLPTKKSSPRYIILKLPRVNDKERIVMASRGKKWW